VLFFSEANNTGYMVVEYEEGEGLDAIIRRGTRFSESQLLEIFIPLLDGLEQVHATGFIHRDIKPSNIFLREDGSPVPLDFGAAPQAVGGWSRTHTASAAPVQGGGESGPEPATPPRRWRLVSLGLHPDKVASAKAEVEAARAEWERVQEATTMAP
jgi:serine/threonine protein kinase